MLRRQLLKRGLFLALALVAVSDSTVSSASATTAEECARLSFDVEAFIPEVNGTVHPGASVRLLKRAFETKSGSTLERVGWFPYAVDGGARSYDIKQISPYELVSGHFPEM